MAIYANIHGRLGADSEVKYSADGKPRLTLRMASDSGFGDNKKTDWVSVTLFGARGEKLAPYLTKGVEILVNGSLSGREYEGTKGKGFSIDVVADNISFTGAKKSEAGATSTKAPVTGETDYSTTAPF